MAAQQLPSGQTLGPSGLISAPASHRDLGRGLDLFHPESHLSDGYWQSLLNMDPEYSGSVRKRVGYENLSGYVPLRASGITLAGTDMTVTLPSWLDVTLIEGEPPFALSYTFQGVLITETVSTYIVDGPTNQLRFTSITNDPFATDDFLPGVTLWGFRAGDLLSSTAASRAGWVNHVDTYRAPEETRAVCGMGGVLYASYLLAERSTSLPAAALPDMAATLGVRYSATYSAGDVDTGADTITFVGHGLQTGHQVTFDAGPPTPLVPGDSYFVIVVDADTIALAIDAFDAGQGTRIDLTSTGSGTMTQVNVIAGLLWGTGDTPSRTYGWVTSDSTATGWASVTDVSFVSAGVASVTLDLPNCAIYGNVSEMVSDGYDQISLKQVGAALFQGTFTVLSCTIGMNQLIATIDVPALIDDRWDTSGGFGAVLTSRLPASSTLLEGSQVRGVEVSYDDAIYLAATSGTDIYVGPVAQQITLSSTPTLYGRVSTQVVPLGTSVNGFVRGDSLTVTGVAQRPQVISVNYSTDESVSITSVGGFASFTSTEAARRAPGDVLLLQGTVDFDGAIEVTSVDGSTVSFASDLIVPVGQVGSIKGRTLSMDEALPIESTSDGSFTVAVHSRWFPLEYPSELGKQRERYFTYLAADDQLFLRSAVSQGSLYVTNGVDPVMKFDGGALTRAGLTRWQAGYIGGRARYFSGVPEAGASKVTAAHAGNRVMLPLGEQAAFTPSEPAIWEGPGGVPTFDQRFTVLSSTDDGTNGQLGLTPTPTSAQDDTSSSFHQGTALAYYARLNAVDPQGRVTASAAVNSHDLTVLFGPSRQVRLKFLRLPWFEGIDYRRLTVQVYRTSGRVASPPFYLVGQFPLSISNGEAYVTLKDSTSPDLLLNNTGRLDPVNSALLGSEIGTTWDGPPRAKFISALGNRLVLGNLRDWPTWDLTPIPSVDVPGGYLTAAQLRGTRFTFRRRGATGTVTDNQDVFTFEVRKQSDSVGGLLVSTAAGQVVLNVPSLPVGVAAGAWTYLWMHGDPRLTTGDLTLRGLFQVASVAGTQVTLLVARQAAPLTGLTNTVDVINTLVPHGLTDGDPLTFTGTGIGVFPGPGTTYYAAPTGPTSFEIYSDPELTTQVTGIGFTAGTRIANKIELSDSVGNGTAVLFASDPRDVPVLIDDVIEVPTDPNTADDLNYRTVPSSDWTSTARPQLELGRRLADAINATQATLSGPGSFQPWLSAAGGDDVGPGQILVRSPVPATDGMPDMEFTPPSGGLVHCFVNDVERTATTSVTARERLFPSRLAVSYPNFPEIYDAPFGDTLFSDSIVDVNPSDGQEITAVIPLFGDSAFGAALRDSTILVFKQYSVYVVKPSVTVNSDGTVAYKYETQRLETNGQGCTYSRLVAPSKHGVLFGNDSGLWKINRSLEIVFLGQIVDRLWGQQRNRTIETDVPCAVHDYYRNKWKGSFAALGESINAHVASYDHTRENGDDDGAWSEYSNVPASGWANVGTDCIFGTFEGQVYRLRSTGNVSDYRDDRDAVGAEDGAVGIYKALDFGTGAARKLIKAFMVQFRVTSSVSTTLVSTGVDLRQSFAACDPFTVSDPVETGVTGLTGTPVQTRRFSAPDRKGQFFQVRLVNTGKDEPLEIVQFDFVTEQMSEAGIRQAAQGSAGSSPSAPSGSPS